MLITGNRHWNIKKKKKSVAHYMYFSLFWWCFGPRAFFKINDGQFLIVKKASWSRLLILNEAWGSKHHQNTEKYTIFYLMIPPQIIYCLKYQREENCNAPQKLPHFLFLVRDDGSRARRQHIGSPPSVAAAPSSPASASWCNKRAWTKSSSSCSWWLSWRGAQLLSPSPTEGNYMVSWWHLQITD